MGAAHGDHGGRSHAPALLSEILLQRELRDRREAALAAADAEPARPRRWFRR